MTEDSMGVFLFLGLIGFMTVCTLLYWFHPDPIDKVVQQCNEVGYYYHGTKTKLVCKIE